MTDRPIIFSAPKWPVWDRRLAKSSLDGFMEFVMPEPNSGCWLWLGPWSTAGYGRLARHEAAHRMSLHLHGVKLMHGLDVHHRCKTRCCVNPDHLVQITHRENLLASETLAAIAARKTHCPAGHPLGGINLAMRSGKRMCRECDRLRQNSAYKPTTSRRRRRHLTRSERDRIAALIAEGRSHSQIAKIVCVSIATVSHVRTGKNRYDRPANNI